MSTAPMKVTNSQLESLAKGLAGLDGISTKDGFRPFVFDDDTTWAIATNTDIITRAVSVLNLALKSLARQHGIKERMPITKENADAVGNFMEAKDALMEREIEIQCIVLLSRAKLNIGQSDKKNPILPSTLANLMPILEP